MLAVFTKIVFTDLTFLFFQGVTIHCKSLKSTKYKVGDREFSTDHPITDLNALTSYTVIIRVTNNMNLSTDETLIIETGELDESGY